jgi:multiple sugar transport system permease protein/raffinose/stachyose/melibiose transport system permease protein
MMTTDSLLGASKLPATVSKRKAHRKPWAAITFFIAPAMLFYAVFILYPLLSTFYYSMTHIAPAGGKLVTTFVGLENFRALAKDSIFFLAARNTLLWGVVGPAIEMVVATLLAMVVYFKVPFHRFYRVAWFTPILVSGVIVGLVFRWIFNFDWGILNNGLRAIGLDELALNWLGRRDTPIWAVIFVHFWATFGFSFVLMLAGCSAIPAELVEAAYIDGASKPRAVWHVVLPLLKPTALTVLILSFMGKMHAFHVVWVLTNGGPLHFSETVATYVQKRAFGWSTYDLGYPSAISVVWFGITVIGVGLISRWLRSKVEI